MKTHYTSNESSIRSIVTHLATAWLKISAKHAHGRLSRLCGLQRAVAAAFQRTLRTVVILAIRVYVLLLQQGDLILDEGVEGCTPSTSPQCALLAGGHSSQHAEQEPMHSPLGLRFARSALTFL